MLGSVAGRTLVYHLRLFAVCRFYALLLWVCHTATRYIAYYTLVLII